MTTVLLQTGTLRRPSTPFPVAVLRAPLAQPHGPQHAVGRAGHALSGADLPVAAMPMPIVPVKNGRAGPAGEVVPVVLPAVLPAGTPATSALAPPVRSVHVAGRTRVRAAA